MNCTEKLREIIAAQLRVAASEITDTTDMVDDLGADSLDVVEILMVIEEEFGVSIPDDEVAGLKKFSALAAYI
ncbi:MAG: acyl carrier protein, partial [Clostridia bacterium]|nr:acyl carrier protein [Clostridia bacterium]